MKYILKKASERIQDDRKAVLAAVKSNGFELEYASARLQDDKEVVLAAVESQGGALRYASKRLQNDKEVVVIAFSHSNENIKYASVKILYPFRKIKLGIGTRFSSVMLLFNIFISKGFQ